MCNREWDSVWTGFRIPFGDVVLIRSHTSQYRVRLLGMHSRRRTCECRSWTIVGVIFADDLRHIIVEVTKVITGRGYREGRGGKCKYQKPHPPKHLIPDKEGNEEIVRLVLKDGCWRVIAKEITRVSTRRSYMESRAEKSKGKMPRPLSVKDRVTYRMV